MVTKGFLTTALLCFLLMLACVPCFLSSVLLADPPFLSLFPILLFSSLYTARPPPKPWDGAYTCCSYSAEGHAWRRETRGSPPTYTRPPNSPPPPRVDLIMTRSAARRPSFPGRTFPGVGVTGQREDPASYPANRWTTHPPIVGPPVSVHRQKPPGAGE